MLPVVEAGAEERFLAEVADGVRDARREDVVVGAVRLLRDVHVWEERIVPRVQVNLEYDHAIDTIRPSGPQGATKEIDTLSLVLQGRL